MATKRYELLFSDERMGHPDLGWMPRQRPTKHDPLGDEDEEDGRYQRYLHVNGITARVYCGWAVVESETEPSKEV